MFRAYQSLPRSVWFLCLGTLVNRAGSFVMIFLAVYLGDELGYGTTFATNAIGLFGLGSIVAAIIGGDLTDRIGRRFVALLSLFGGAAFLLILSALEHPLAIQAAIFLFAVFSEMYRPAVSSMIGDFVASEQRPHAFSLLYVAINLGFSIGALAGAELVKVSYTWLFYVDAITMAVFGVFMAFFIPESKPRASTATTSSSDADLATATRDGDTLDSPVNDDSFLRAARRILSDVPFLFFCLASLLVTAVFMQSFGSLPLHMGTLGIGADVYARILSINGIMIVICQIPVTSLFASARPMRVLAAGALLVGIGFALVGVAESIPLLVFTVVLWTLGEILQAPFNHSVTTELAPLDLRGRYMGMLGMSFSCGMTLGAPVGGYVLDRFGSDALWFGCGGSTLVAVAIYAAVARPINERIAAQRTRSTRTPQDSRPDVSGA